MRAKINSTKIGKGIRQNWFSIVILALLIFIFLNKDLSFSFNIASPDKVQPKEVPPKKAPKTKEFLADQETVKPEEKSTLNIMSFGFGKDVDNRAKRLALLESTPVAVIRAYIKRFSHVAENEQKKYGIPASVILANAIYLSGAGKSAESATLNNHFAISCEGWNGASGEVDGICFRKYESAWAGFRNYSMVMSEGRFAELLSYGDRDFKAWANGLDRLNYVSDGDYAKSLKDVIQQYALYEFDD